MDFFRRVQVWVKSAAEWVFLGAVLVAISVATAGMIFGLVVLPLWVVVGLVGAAIAGGRLPVLGQRGPRRWP